MWHINQFPISLTYSVFFSFIQQCLDDEDIADSDDESSGDEVFGITTVINLSHHKVHNYTSESMYCI